MAPKYDPMGELDRAESPTPISIAEYYHVEEYETNAESVSEIQLELATALGIIGKETMNDTAKWDTVQTILRAMAMIDQFHNIESTITVNTKEGESFFEQENEIAVETANVE